MENITDKELFESALSDAPIETTAEPAPANTPAESPAPASNELARDEHGRFAPKAQDAAPAIPPGDQQQQPAGNGAEGLVPSFRLREATEQTRALEQRLAERDAFYQRQIQEMQARLPPAQPQQQPEPPDWFVDPDARLQQGLQQAISPIQQHLATVTETFSKRDAEREFGAEKVSAAYGAMDQALRSRDPEAVAAYQRAMQSVHPYGEIMNWHQKAAVFSQIGNDPNAWFERQLEERLAKDPQFAAIALQRIQQNTRQAPNAQGNIQLPPSLNRLPSAQSSTDDDNDGSAEGLFRHALGR